MKKPIERLTVNKEWEEAERLFPLKKALQKSEVLKLKPGALLSIKWADSPNDLALLLEKPSRESGDVSLKCFYFGHKDVNRHAVHSQVVAFHGYIDPLLVTAFQANEATNKHPELK